MRIIAGTLRGKSIISPEGLTTRPTSDRAREMLFNILNSLFLKQGIYWSDLVFADVFAGSGAIGIEALSRGVKEVFFIENNPQALSTLRKNTTGLTNIQICNQDALNPPAHKPVHILFMDPPYGKGLWQAALQAFKKAGWISDQTLIIIETDKKLNEEEPTDYRLIQKRSAGRNTFLFMQPKKES